MWREKGIERKEQGRGVGFAPAVFLLDGARLALTAPTATTAAAAASPSLSGELSERRKRQWS